MAALDDGIKWKVEVLKGRLAVAEKELADDSANPAKRAKVPDDEKLVERYKHELDVVKGNDKRKAYDLVKANLEHAIDMAIDDLASLEGFLAHRPKSDPAATGAARKKLAELRDLLKRLENEGRP